MDSWVALSNTDPDNVGYFDRDYPDTHCKPHGAFVGYPGGADYMCGLCEDGLTKWIADPEFMLQINMIWDISLEGQDLWWPSEQHGSRSNTAFWRLSHTVGPIASLQAMIFKHQAMADTINNDPKVIEAGQSVYIEYRAIQINEGWWDTP